MTPTEKKYKNKYAMWYARHMIEVRTLKARNLKLEGRIKTLQREKALSVPKKSDLEKENEKLKLQNRMYRKRLDAIEQPPIEQQMMTRPWV